MGQTGYSLVALAACVLVTGCASMSSEECVTADWRGIGYEDGVRGLPGDEIGRYREACAKDGITPDLDAYRAGRSQGLAEFCTAAQGFNYGSRGGRYAGVCPAATESAFLAGYRRGARLHDLQGEANAAAGRVRYLRGQIDRVEDEARKKTVSLVSDDLSRDERVELAADLAKLVKRKGQYQRDLEDAVARQAKAEAALEDYQSELADGQQAALGESS